MGTQWRLASWNRSQHRSFFGPRGLFGSPFSGFWPFCGVMGDWCSPALGIGLCGMFFFHSHFCMACLLSYGCQAVEHFSLLRLFSMVTFFILLGWNPFGGQSFFFSSYLLCPFCSRHVGIFLFSVPQRFIFTGFVVAAGLKDQDSSAFPDFSMGSRLCWRPHLLILLFFFQASSFYRIFSVSRRWFSFCIRGILVLSSYHMFLSMIGPCVPLFTFWIPAPLRFIAFLAIRVFFLTALFSTVGCFVFQLFF